jgi:hypothetical protein
MDTCRGCDGRRITVREDRDNCFKKITRDCSRCGGTGNEPEPSKSGKRRFSKPKDEEDMTLEEQTRAFLAKHGY